MNEKKYYPELNQTASADDLESKRLRFMQGIQELKASKPEMVKDFQQPASKDVKREVIDTITEVPKTNISDFHAEQSMREIAKKRAQGKSEDVYDYGKWRKEFAAKNKPVAKAVGKKLLGAIPVIGGIAQAIASQDASAAIPGLDAESLGPAKGTLDYKIENALPLTPEEKQELLMQQARAKALRSF